LQILPAAMHQFAQTTRCVDPGALLWRGIFAARRRRGALRARQPSGAASGVCKALSRRSGPSTALPWRAHRLCLRASQAAGGRALSGQPLLKRYAAPAQAFAQRYTRADIALLAQVDREFGTLSVPVTAHVLH
jgi:hypothetical protein